jgi:hypothetical protein
MATYGTCEMLREVIAEQLWAIASNCEIGCRYAELGDDHGLGYALRRITASLRVAIATAADLAEFPQPEGRTGKAWTTEDAP